jgi:Ca2+-binding EF-hand superfamily protein
MDFDEKGMLSPANVKMLELGERLFLFSSAFLERLFDVMQTFDGRIDFALFMKLVTNLQFLLTRPAAHFFFEIFDLDQDGKVTAPDLMYFYRGIQNEATSPPPVDVFLADVFDKCQCDCTGFTEADIFTCGRADEVVRLLIDLNDSPFGEEDHE